MATQQNVVEIVLRSVNQMSTDLARVEQQLGSLQKTTDVADASTQRLARSNVALRGAIAPARVALSQVTTAAATLRPEFSLLIGSIDNVIFSMIQVARTAPTVGAAMSAVFITGGITAAIIGLTAVIGYFVSKWKEARDAIFDYNKTMVDLDAAQEKLAATTERQIIEIEAQRKMRQLDEDAIKTNMAADDKANKLSLIARERSIALSALDIKTRNDLREVFINQAQALNLERIELEQGTEARRQAELEMIIMNTVRKAGIELTVEEQTALSNMIQAILSEARALEELKTKFDEANKAAQELADVRVKVARGRRQTVEEEEKLLKERLEKLGLDARTLSQGIMAAIEGGQKGLLDFAARTGRRIAESLMEGMIEALVISPLKTQLQQAMAALFQSTVGGKGGTGFNIPGLFSQILGLGGRLLGGLPGLFKTPLAPLTPFEVGAGLEHMNFARGGMVVPRYGMPELNLPQLRRFQSGGVVEGPTLGVIGEEGPEIVARMKPAGSRDAGQPKVTVVINGDITPRRPDMRPEDVIKVVANDAERGGDVGRAMQNVIRRAR